MTGVFPKNDVYHFLELKAIWGSVIMKDTAKIATDNNLPVFCVGGLMSRPLLLTVQKVRYCWLLKLPLRNAK